MSTKLLVMGVSGCGKSTVAESVALALACPVIEGDEHHPLSNRQKMKRGLALDDDDRMPWLDRLGALLAQASGSVVMSCSALKRSYRDRLRAAAPELRIAYLRIEIDEAKRRVAARASHFFPASLVDNQFDTLESPDGETGVRVIEAVWPKARQRDAILAWLASPPGPSTQETTP